MKQIFIFLMIVFAILLSLSSCAQSTVKKDDKGNYIAVSSKKVGVAAKPVATGQTYTDSKGIVYPVFITSGKKLYIVRVSSKTKKEYKQYLKVEGEDKE